MNPRNRRFGVRLAVLPFLLSKVANAATWTVCPSGCSFTDIQSAINAASPGDTILVLAGSYGPFVLDKPLRILGIGPGLVVVSAPGYPLPAPAVVQVQGIPAGQFAILAGMKIQIVTAYPPCVFCILCAPPWDGVSALGVSNCPGWVALSNLEVDPGHYFHGIRADSSALVLLDHAQVAAQQASSCSPTSCPYGSTCIRKGVWASDTNLSLNASSVLGNTSSTSLRITGNSRSLVARSSLTGSNGISLLCGLTWPFSYSQGLPGGHGLEAESGADIRVAAGPAALLQGGNGGYGSGLHPSGAFCCPGGSGGHALTSSGATVSLDPGLPLVPGTGVAASGCPGSPGQAINGSGVTVSSSPLPSLGVSPALASPGGSVSLDLKGPALAPFSIGVSLAPGFLPISGVGGVLLLDPATLFVPYSGTLDPSGSASIGAAVPLDSLLSGLVLLLQPAALDPTSGAMDLGPAVAFVVL